MNKHRQKILDHIKDEREKLKKVKKKPEFLKEQLLMMNLMEDFINRSEHEKIDKHLCEQLIKYYEKFEKLEGKEEKQFFHTLLDKTIDHKESKTEIKKRMAAFDKAMKVYENIVRYHPNDNHELTEKEKKEHAPKVKKKQKKFAKQVLEEVEEGVTMVDMAKTVATLGTDMGLAELLPLALFII
jgi:hypothetical protein